MYTVVNNTEKYIEYTKVLFTINRRKGSEAKLDEVS